jgi:uncharacterized protein YcbK (DUF882 family)
MHDQVPSYQERMEQKVLRLFAAYRAGMSLEGTSKGTVAKRKAPWRAPAGYVKPSVQAARAIRAARTRHCKHCGFDILLSAWPRDRSGHLKERCAPCMEAYRAPKPKKRPSPEWKAAYRRRRGEVVGDYVPVAERQRVREERLAARHDQHVKAWVRFQARAARAAERKLLHSAHVEAFKHSAVRFRRRYANDSAFAIKQRLRTQLRKKAKLYPKLDDLMRSAINRRGESHTVEVVCGYRITELVTHLESQFADGMDWPAFMRGEVHIDHKRPQASFDLTDADQVRACWALSNLQPLWARDNISKGAKWDGRAAA